MSNIIRNDKFWFSFYFTASGSKVDLSCSEG